ncbi:hypothetical protein QR680_001664 [Steinernema hermaphroditum]|uniref:Ig-like domain-containing protein n=1 Tax=Steinernema hermaphroditum TaxID=289476 RepID=A0AA39GZD8_9BILA|nr:hypothetical protein QR680_001664 [Steinernema hermaphroditum]
MKVFILLVLLCLFALCNGWSVSVDPRDEEIRLVNAGSPFAVICRLNGVDPEQERPGLVWIKVNGDVFHTGHVKIQRLDDYSLSMFIENGTHEDDGVYECHASYHGRTQTASIVLKYRENMTFVENNPSSIVPIVGREVRLSCQVTGMKSQNVMVMWQKDIVAITESTNKEYIFADNGQTIYIPNVVFARDRGTFVCRVLNIRTGEVIAKSFEIAFPRTQEIERTCTSVCKDVCQLFTQSD